MVDQGFGTLGRGDEAPERLLRNRPRVNYAQKPQAVDTEAEHETAVTQTEPKGKKRKRKDEDSGPATRSSTSKAKKPRTKAATAKGEENAVPKKKAQATTRRSSQANAKPSARTTAARGGKKGAKKTAGSAESEKSAKTTSKPPRQSKRQEKNAAGANDASVAEDSSTKRDAELPTDEAQPEAQALPTLRKDEGEDQPEANPGVSSTEAHDGMANTNRPEAASPGSLTLNSMPAEQDSSTMALGSALIDTAVHDLASDSELSDVPEDIDMSAPAGSTSNAPQPTEAQVGDPASSAPQSHDADLESAPPTEVELPSSIPTPPASDRTPRVRTADKVPAELDSDEADDDAGQSTVEDESFQPTQPAPKKQTRKAATRKTATKPKPKPRGVSKKSSKKPTLKVTLEISKDGLQGLTTGMSSTSKSESLVTPKKPLTKSSGHAQSGLLTPPDSQRGRSREEELTLEEDSSSFDRDLLELSKKLTERKPISEKDPPVGAPEVWADSRQALCETVPYFKMPQSGCHQNDRHVYSFLFDNVGHCREYMDTDVVISRAGGSMEADSTGKMVQKQDHVMTDSQVLSVKNDIDLENPLIIICGQKHQGAICKLPYRYNVMGWYKPIMTWAEKTEGKGKKSFVTIKYRFERLNEKKQAWHAPNEPICSLGEGEKKPLVSDFRRKVCQHCQEQFYQIYLLGWMCLNPTCVEFWKVDGRPAPCGKLTYNPAFLLHRTPWEVEEEPYSVKPPVPEVGKFVGDDLTYINTRGICCPECGRCSSRRFFKGWKCENPDCSYENFPTHIPVKVPMLHTPMDNTGDGPGLARNKHADGVKVKVEHLHGFKVYRYTVDGVKGSFVHLVSNAKINRIEGGADDMFHAIQDQSNPDMDLHLERRRFGVEKMGGIKSEKQSTSNALAGADVTQTEQFVQDSVAEPPMTESQSTTLDQDAETALPAPTPPVVDGTQSDQADQEDAVQIPTTEPQSTTPEQDASTASTAPAGTDDSQTGQSIQNVNTEVPTTNPQPINLEQDAAIRSPEVVQETAKPQSTPPEQDAATASTAPVVVDSTQGEQSVKDVNTEVPTTKPQSTPPEQDAAVRNPDAAQDGDFMTAFSMNYGMPYKFVASGASRPFKDAPWPVRAVRADLNWASEEMLGTKDHADFNEELIFAYLQGQKIEYHDDGEEGLGPRIATMSLGGKATMSLRMKMKHYTGCSKTGILTAERPIPGGIDGDEGYTKRLEKWTYLQTIKDSDRTLYEKRRKELPRELGLYEKRNKKAADLVTVTLNHGDIILMEGYDIQKYLEHKVVPEGCLRFALTCRVVQKGHLKPEEVPEYGEEPDDPSNSALRKMADARKGEVGGGGGEI